MRRLSYWMAAALLGSAALTAALAGELSLAALLDRLAPEQGGLAASYEETRHDPLAEEPIRLRGELHYRHPGQLRKTERLPDGEEREIRIADDLVHLRDQRGERTTRLNQVPGLEPLMAVLDAIGGGDADTLEAHFQRVELDGDAEDWQLALEAAPRPAPGRGGGSRRSDEAPLHLTLSGQAAWIDEIELDAPRQGRIRLRLIEALE